MRRVLACLALVVASTAGAGLPTPASAAPSDDPLAERQHHLRTVRAYRAWTVTRGGGTVVAVVDTGVDRSHPDLRGRLVPGVDLVERRTPPDDDNGHGTLVAGIVAATAGNGLGVAGVAPGARIMPVRVLDRRGRGTSDVVAQGIRWAVAHGADVINLSLADVPGRRRPASDLITRDVELAIRQASLEGVLVVVAAGNERRRTTPYAADVPVLVVGATNARDRLWRRSNRDRRTLFAPGVNIVSTYPGGAYAVADGTSFAAPIVAGGAALLHAQGLSPAGIQRRLVATAAPGPAGAGRVDLAAAVGAAPPVQRPDAQRRPEKAAAGQARALPGGPTSPRRLSGPGEAAPDAPARPAPAPTPSLLPTEPPDAAAPAPADLPEVGADGTSRREPTSWPVGVAVALLAANVVALVVLLGRRRAGPL